MMQKAKKKLSEVFHSLHGYACLPIHASSDDWFYFKATGKTDSSTVCSFPTCIVILHKLLFDKLETRLFLTSQSLCLL